MNRLTLRQYLISQFESFLSEERRTFIRRVLDNRTAYIQVILEDILDPHNTNAIIRSGECIGIQHFHIIEDKNAFKTGRGVSRGAIKWVDIHRHDPYMNNPTAPVLKKIKSDGFKLLVTSPSAAAIPVENVKMDRPVAVLLGNEKEGTSSTAVQMADELITIPLQGFTESLNVSVAAGMVLQQLTHTMRRDVQHWRFSAEEREQYLLQWYKKSMARPDEYEEYFVKEFEKMSS